MNALSRREEGKLACLPCRLTYLPENLLKITKERAVKECHDVVKEFADCVGGRTLSVAWACRKQLRTMEDCILL
ncbi:hypothetical protein C8R45DRAFT_953349 [Mycena sanguinolenta]|nr:hypothetical protein C8R45DRAFT_953349 [Mycena sanguinolenta]